MEHLIIYFYAKFSCQVNGDINSALQYHDIPFFFISQNALKERKRGATHSTQGVYKGKPKEKKISEKENPAN
jgi:hypothetical protein